MKINEVITETTTAGAIASAYPDGGNGFVNGGPGTLTRMGQPKSKRKTKKSKKS